MATIEWHRETGGVAGWSVLRGPTVGLQLSGVSAARRQC
jgi:hypothetical protein